MQQFKLRLAWNRADVLLPDDYSTFPVWVNTRDNMSGHGKCTITATTPYVVGEFSTEISVDPEQHLMYLTTPEADEAGFCRITGFFIVDYYSGIERHSSYLLSNILLR